MSARTTLTPGTGLSPPPHLHALQGTILREHVCVLSNGFFLQFHKNMNVWVRKRVSLGLGLGRCPRARPWCSVRITGTGREEGGHPAAGRWGWDSLGRQLPQQEQAA